MDEHAFAGRQPTDLAQCMPGGEIRDADRGRFTIRQPVGDRDDQVGKCRQVGTEGAGTQGDDALADLDRIDTGAAAVTMPDTLAADAPARCRPGRGRRPWP